jgi:hypothetical protein
MEASIIRPQPGTISFVLTTACNRQCPSCAVRIPEMLVRHVTVPELEEMGKHLGPVNCFAVSGGEPTLHPQFGEVIDAIIRSFKFNTLNMATTGARLLQQREHWGKFDYIGLACYPEHECFPGIPNNKALVDEIVSHFVPIRELKYYAEYSLPGEKTHLCVWGPIVHHTTARPGRTNCQRLWHTCLVKDGEIFPCCSLPKNAVGVKIEPGWRERWPAPKADCDTCLLV